MAAPNETGPTAEPAKAPSIFRVLGPYRGLIALLVLFSILSNAATLAIPLLISHGIDAYGAGSFAAGPFAIEFLSVALFILLFVALQSIVQTMASERVARDMRERLAHKISRQSARFIEEANPSKLLTNLTSDIDAVKMFVAQAVVQLVASAVIIVGAAVTLLVIDWKLALAVLTIIPVIGGTFFLILRRVRALFHAAREVIDRLNKVISESILGASLIRVLHAESVEHGKFAQVNAKALDIGIGILNLFSFMIPIITFVASMAVLAVVVLGGTFVVSGTMTLGQFVAFNSYISILIFPILIIGFMSNVIAQANVSYARISQVLDAPDAKEGGTDESPLSGQIDAEGITVRYGERAALKEVSFSIKPKTRTAIIGPTAAGKTQLLSCLTGLITPQSGRILYDGTPLPAYERTAFYAQIGLVFQDSILFNTSIRENIAFSKTVTDEALAKAIDTAELAAFIDTLPEGLDTIVSERGASLSGGQKQRIMLARALSLDPSILFLDDFTARVDASTEAKILANLARNYPDLTLVSVTQKIASALAYDQIIVLMEGELLARGTHEELLASSPEYVQIYESQRSTSTYELRS